MSYSYKNRSRKVVMDILTKRKSFITLHELGTVIAYALFFGSILLALASIILSVAL